LRAQFLARPNVTRVVLLRTNAGQHAAIMAGFAHCRGKFVFTLDADLQNPPEEIPKLLALMDSGHDYVGSIRINRRDKRWRHIASLAMNHLRDRITSIHISDQGCMFRAYHCDVVAAMLESRESQIFIPALAYLYAINPTEVYLRHEARAGGESKYSIFSLLRLNFDLITGFSIVPLQVFSLLGMGISLFSLLLFIYLFLRRLFFGPEVEGVFTLFAIAFFIMGLLLFAVGVLGEYVGRIYGEVRRRPRYIVRDVWRQDDRPQEQAAKQGCSS
jgi:undecaprenyl-phosphate 4-deoxy-4-formamido-L-arabinose transferase